MSQARRPFTLENLSFHNKGGRLVVKSLKSRICKFISSATSVERAWIAANSLKLCPDLTSRSRVMPENVPLQGKIFLLHAVICWQHCIWIWADRAQLVVSWKHSKVCRILLQVQKSPKIMLKNHVLGCTAFANTLVTLQICGLIIVIDVDLVTLASLSRVKKSGRIQY